MTTGKWWKWDSVWRLSWLGPKQQLINFYACLGSRSERSSDSLPPGLDLPLSSRVTSRSEAADVQFCSNRMIHVSRLSISTLIQSCIQGLLCWLGSVGAINRWEHAVLSLHLHNSLRACKADARSIITEESFELLFVPTSLPTTLLAIKRANMATQAPEYSALWTLRGESLPSFVGLRRINPTSAR